MEHIKITKTDEQRIILANSLLQKNQDILAGLVCVTAFESIIDHFFKTSGCARKGVEVRELVHKIDIIKENAKLNISTRLGELLDSSRERRNDIVHDNKRNMKIFAKNNGFSTEQSLLNSLVDISNINVDVNYEELAKIEEIFCPGSWVKIGGDLPDELSEKHFANLKFAAQNYMAPLGKYLENSFLRHKGCSLKFQKISRVDYTSGYVWLSAVDEKMHEGKYRPRVTLPGLTVVLKPTGVHVYIELPGKAIKYKRAYYKDLLHQDNLLKLLKKSKLLQKKCYVFFHTWWFADIEFVEGEIKGKKNSGMIKTYLSTAKNEASERKQREAWKMEKLITERSKEIDAYDDADPSSPAITRNSFLIGRFYSRKDCLNTYKKDLHQHIRDDFEALYPILKVLYEKAGIQ